jgi:hypothetical protein
MKVLDPKKSRAGGAKDIFGAKKSTASPHPRQESLLKHVAVVRDQVTLGLEIPPIYRKHSAPTVGRSHCGRFQARSPLVHANLFKSL